MSHIPDASRFRATTGNAALADVPRGLKLMAWHGVVKTNETIAGAFL
jgi:hypothetical protein